MIIEYKCYCVLCVSYSLEMIHLNFRFHRKKMSRVKLICFIVMRHALMHYLFAVCIFVMYCSQIARRVCVNWPGFGTNTKSTIGYFVISVCTMGVPHVFTQWNVMPLYSIIVEFISLMDENCQWYPVLYSHFVWIEFPLNLTMDMCFRCIFLSKNCLSRVWELCRKIPSK